MQKHIVNGVMCNSLSISGQDIVTSADSSVTSLHCDVSGGGADGGHLLVAGFGDGTVRVFDRRMASSDASVLTFREHATCIVAARLREGSGGLKVVSAEAGGKVKVWSCAAPEQSRRNVEIKCPLTSAAVHEHCDVFAIASQQQFIGVLSEAGAALSTIKYHDGFMGQRIAPVTCMAFHPYKVRACYLYGLPSLQGTRMSPA